MARRDKAAADRARRKHLGIAAALMVGGLGVTTQVGRITQDPETGKETVQEAKVLSVANGVVLQIGERIETQAPGRIVFAEVRSANRSSWHSLMRFSMSPRAQ